MQGVRIQTFQQIQESRNELYIRNRGELFADDGIKDVRDGAGWTMSINEATGKMVMTAAGDGFAVVVFGACTLR